LHKDNLTDSALRRRLFINLESSWGNHSMQEEAYLIMSIINSPGASTPI
jgi:hypothetical protein